MYAEGSLKPKRSEIIKFYSYIFLSLIIIAQISIIADF